MLAFLAFVAACSGDTATAPDNLESISALPPALSVSPRKVTAEINQPIRFQGTRLDLSGRRVFTPIAWSSTGGAITADGTFSSSTTGSFKVIGRGRWKHADTAIVIVVPTTDSIARLRVSPDTATLSPDGTRTFTATAYMLDGSTSTVGVNWTATGGSVDAGGTYTAGTTAGTYRVVAATTAGNVADTSSVIITAPAPAPAPTLAAVYVTPTSASLSAGVTQTFRAYGRNSVGDSVSVAVAFAATGGTITSSGLYTAGSTAGSFRVVATESTTGYADTAAISVTVPVTSVTGTGIPFGPWGLWSSSTSVSWGPAPFTLSQNSTDPSTIVTQIAAARTMKQKLVLAMTGGAHSNYLTNGAFDLSKWKARMDKFNTSTIRNAVAQGVSDGTILGNSIMDEPEFKDWGGVMTKPLLDQMAAYGKVYFPTLPMGLNHGPNGYYQWRPDERYRVVDYVVNQYNWWVTKGDVVAWRDKVLAQAALDGIKPAFSLNLLNGGVQDTDGTWDCTGTGGLGTRSPNCRMTASQVKTWASSLVGSGCAMLMWKYDDAFVSRTDNQQAFSDVATLARGLPGRSCRRS